MNRLRDVAVFELGLVDVPAVPDAEFLIVDDDDEHAEAVQAKALSLLRQGEKP